MRRTTPPFDTGYDLVLRRPVQSSSMTFSPECDQFDGEHRTALSQLRIRARLKVPHGHTCLPRLELLWTHLSQVCTLCRSQVDTACVVTYSTSVTSFHTENDASRSRLTFRPLPEIPSLWGSPYAGRCVSHWFAGPNSAIVEVRARVNSCDACGEFVSRHRTQWPPRTVSQAWSLFAKSVADYSLQSLT